MTKIKAKVNMYDEKLKTLMSTWHVSTVEAWQQGRYDGDDDIVSLEAGREEMIQMMINNIFDGRNFEDIWYKGDEKIYNEVDNKTEYNDWLTEVFGVLLKGTKWVR
jgi:triacylglycerol esterase/lipase EstA (alpha/beta hydrolase family)